MKLPKSLREISGLTTHEGLLLAVGDERARVYAIDFDAPEVDKLLDFGDPPRRGDFEGITTLDGILYVTTSDGLLLSRPLDDSEDGDPVSETVTGIGQQCEVEGLAARPGLEQRQGHLFLACKTARRKPLRDRLTIFAWSLSKNAIDAESSISVPLSTLGLAHLHPSGLHVTDRNTLLVVAGKEKKLLELNFDGEVMLLSDLPNPGHHPQTEGITMDASGRLYLADEGGRKRGTITRYEHTVQ